MTDEDNPGEDPTNLMTLDQFHDRIHREALIRKGFQGLTTSHKKGRVEKGESCNC